MRRVKPLQTLQNGRNKERRVHDNLDPHRQPDYAFEDERHTKHNRLNTVL